MGSRLSVMLSVDEWKVLFKMAKDDCREPRDQMRWLLTQEARRRDLMPDPQRQGENETTISTAMPKLMKYSSEY
jgi:hypothetical protein